MSDVSLPTAAHGHKTNGDAHAHPTFLAHHFETPEQQFISAKFGMWVFLATELLMFGGLFCAYAVYRHNHPEVFDFAHQALDKIMGGINTVVLIASSLTMAWAVRASQLGKQKLLVGLLAVTIVGGYGFMTIKAIEYHHKYEVGLWVGEFNKYNKDYKAPAGTTVSFGMEGHDPGHAEAEKPTGPVMGTVGNPWVDPNAGSGDEAKIKPPFVQAVGLASTVVKSGPEFTQFGDMAKSEQERVNAFFSIYFTMTGLHGVHVVVGMSLIFWVLVRAATPAQRKWIWPAGLASAGLYLLFCGLLTGGYVTGGHGEHHASLGGLPGLTFGLGAVCTLVGGLMTLLGLVRGRNLAGAGEFGPEYFTPVDLVGLYWHLVDLIWIFLFPLLYLIH